METRNVKKGAWSKTTSSLTGRVSKEKFNAGLNSRDVSLISGILLVDIRKNCTEKDSPGQSLPGLDCNGCGVCCLHMGYPAFILPQTPRTEAEIDADPKLKKLALDPRTRKRLLEGIPGEDYWHKLPEHLRDELNEFVSDYRIPAADNPDELDGPCFWLDPETRLCKHHEHRPNVCRDFDIGSKGCLDWRWHYADRIETPTGSKRKTN